MSTTAGRSVSTCCSRISSPSSCTAADGFGFETELEPVGAAVVEVDEPFRGGPAEEPGEAMARHVIEAIAPSVSDQGATTGIPAPANARMLVSTGITRQAPRDGPSRVRCRTPPRWPRSRRARLRVLDLSDGLGDGAAPLEAFPQLRARAHEALDRSGRAADVHEEVGSEPPGGRRDEPESSGRFDAARCLHRLDSVSLRCRPGRRRRGSRRRVRDGTPLRGPPVR